MYSSNMGCQSEKAPLSELFIHSINGCLLCAVSRWTLDAEYKWNKVVNLLLTFICLIQSVTWVAVLLRDNHTY